MTQYRSVGRTDFEVVDPGVINYAKGLPVDKALHEDTILAWAHNGEYLTHVHGAPLRLVVPGWAGNWWVKWIERIEVLDHMPDFYYQTHYFVSGASPEDPDKRPMMALGVKALITSPRDDDGPIKRGTHAIRGRTWSGEGAVVRVEVSTDGGESWEDATIEESGDRWLWRRFHYLWEVDAPGQYTLMARGDRREGAGAAGDGLELPAQALRRHRAGDESSSSDGVAPRSFVLRNPALSVCRPSCGVRCHRRQFAVSFSSTVHVPVSTPTLWISRARSAFNRVRTCRHRFRVRWSRDAVDDVRSAPAAAKW